MRTNVLEYISVLRKQIPTRDELSNLREFPSQKDIRALLSKMLDNVPSNKDIIRLTEELEGAVSRIRSLESLIKRQAQKEAGNFGRRLLWIGE
jgi:vacuolar-type H+-ATPase subunit E/Vma4